MLTDRSKQGLVAIFQWDWFKVYEWFFSEISTLVSSYINENDDIWVNGEDLKYEYTYFAVDEMSGEINISGERKNTSI